jgi:hypothetical protein
MAFEGAGSLALFRCTSASSFGDAASSISSALRDNARVVSTGNGFSAASDFVTCAAFSAFTPCAGCSSVAVRRGTFAAS